MITQHVTAQGDENVRGTHESTLELTTDDWLTPAGDCILGINASHSAADFEPEFINAASDPTTEITCTLSVGTVSTQIIGRGASELTFRDPRSLVLRTSTYVDERTVMVEANRAAIDIERELISELQTGAELSATFSLST